jgi:cytoskeletal protein CcmA (bactofilin family)
MWNRDGLPADRSGGDPHTLPASAPVPTRDEPKEIPVVYTGSSLRIKGELLGSEDLTIDGNLEGRIDLPDSALTVGPKGLIQAQVVARVVSVLGSVRGNVTARDKIEIREGGSIYGDLASPRLVIHEGGHFDGRVNMEDQSTRAHEPSPAAKHPLVAAVEGHMP